MLVKLHWEGSAPAACAAERETAPVPVPVSSRSSITGQSYYVWSRTRKLEGVAATVTDPPRGNSNPLRNQTALILP